MRKNVLFLILLFLISTTSLFSQTNSGFKGVVGFTIGGEYNIPVSQVYKTVLKANGGLVGKVVYGISDKALITLTSGTSTYDFKLFVDKQGKAPLYGPPATQFIPVLVGYRNYFGNAYLEPQLGAIHYISKEYGKKVGSGNNFAFGLSAGYEVGEGFEIGIRYQYLAGNSGSFDSGSMLGFGAALKFFKGN